MVSNVADNWKAERAKNWFVLLYQDDPTHVKCLELLNSGNHEYDWVACLHDSDKKDDGELKKAHYHVLFRFKNAVWNTALAADLGIQVNYTSRVESWNKAARYLVHKDNPDKFQYEKEKLFGSDTDKALNAIAKGNPDEEQIVAVAIIEYIYSIPGYIKTAELVRAICEKKWYAVFRRNTSLFMSIVNERNYEYRMKQNTSDSNRLEAERMSNVVNQLPFHERCRHAVDNFGFPIDEL